MISAVSIFQLKGIFSLKSLASFSKLAYYRVNFVEY